MAKKTTEPKVKKPRKPRKGKLQKEYEAEIASYISVIEKYAELSNNPVERDDHDGDPAYGGDIDFNIDSGEKYGKFRISFDGWENAIGEDKKVNIMAVRVRFDTFRNEEKEMKFSCGYISPNGKLVFLRTYEDREMIYKDVVSLFDYLLP